MLGRCGLGRSDVGDRSWPEGWLAGCFGVFSFFFFFQAEDGIRDLYVTGVQTVLFRSPPLSLLMGGLDFSNKFMILRAAKDGSMNFNTPADAAKAGAITLNYGNFITLAINFLIVAGAVFLLVRAINRLKQPKHAEPIIKDCPACAMTIPIKATRCPHCTTEFVGQTGA